MLKELVILFLQDFSHQAICTFYRYLVKTTLSHFGWKVRRIKAETEIYCQISVTTHLNNKWHLHIMKKIVHFVSIVCTPANY